MMEAIQAFFRRDWATLLAGGIIVVFVLSFIGAPRALSEMVAGTADAFTGRHGGTHVACLLLAMPTGLLARSWRAALIGIGVAVGAVFVIGVDLPSDDETRGIVIIGIVMTIGIVAAVTRILLHDHSVSRRNLIVAAVFVAVIGVVGAVGLPKPSSPDANTLVTDMNVVEDFGQPDLLANMFGPTAMPPPVDPLLDNATMAPAGVANQVLRSTTNTAFNDRLYDAVRATGMPMYTGEADIAEAPPEAAPVVNTD